MSAVLKHTNGTLLAAAAAGLAAGAALAADATRVLPPSYQAGLPLAATIVIDIPEGAIALALEDRPPPGWVVDESSITEGGTWDAVNAKVKWGPYLAPAFPETVSYVVTPADGESGQHCFDGGVSLDGGFEAIAGDDCTVTGLTCESIADCADLDGDAIRDDPCVWWACEDGLCVATPVLFADMGGSAGDCRPDGAADGNDYFHALNCFTRQGTTGPGSTYPCEEAPPQAYNVDVVGWYQSCVPDGVCDGNDVFAAQNAFILQAVCSCPLDGGPAPLPGAPFERPRRQMRE